MKPALLFALALLFFASDSHAQSAAAAKAPNQTASPADAANPTAGCGPGGERYDVTTDKNPKPDPAPEPGKAAVYFVQDDRFFANRPRPTVLWGVDGSWAGATRSSTYFRIDVNPGEHHLCARWYDGTETALAHFSAAPGKSYYFSARNLAWHDYVSGGMLLEPVDSDEGALLASQSGYSVATPKK